MSSPNVLLNYLFSTSPSRLQVSTSASPTSGRIDVSVSTGGTDLYCSQIEVAVPIGSDATDFSENTPTAVVNTADWSVSNVSVKSGRELGRNINTNFASFTFVARDPSVYKIDYNLVLSLTAAVNQQVGSFEYIVQEISGTDPNTFTPKQSTFPLDKVLPTFYLESLVATTVTSPLVPATEFANGNAIRLAWESNGTWFQLYKKGNPTPIYSGPATTFTVSDGVATDTTYFLQASMTGDPSHDGSGFEPIYLFDSLTVTISNPDLTPKSVAVSGSLSTEGTTSLQSTTVNGTLAVNNTSSLQSTTVNGSLTVNNTSSLQSTTVNGTLAVNNTSNLQTTAVNGNLGVTESVAIQGALTLAGLASLLGNVTPLNTDAGYTATTDGFVVGTVDGSALTSGNGAMRATSGGSTVFATGGTRIVMISGTWSDWGYDTSWSSNSCVLPVKKGDSFSLQTVSNGNAPNFSAFWIPIGSGAPVMAPDESVKLSVPAMSTMEVSSVKMSPDVHSERRNLRLKPDHFSAKNRTEGIAAELVEILETFVGKTLEQDLKARLAKVIRGL